MLRIEATSHIQRKYGKWIETEIEGEELIDMIYDDFESRTCENCKHWSLDLEYGHKLGYCDKDIGNSLTIDNVTKHNFGCNRWEKKQ